MKYIAAIFFILLGFNTKLYAQFGGCIDSLAISPGFPCPSSDFMPVCGCDNKTYRTLCDAQLRNGVQTYTDGPCSGFEFDIIPTFDPNSITFTLVQADPRNAQLFIVDISGRTWIQRQLVATTRNQFTIEISTLNHGPYIIYIFDSRENYRFKRFVKTPG